MHDLENAPSFACGGKAVISSSDKECSLIVKSSDNKDFCTVKVNTLNFGDLLAQRKLHSHNKPSLISRDLHFVLQIPGFEYAKNKSVPEVFTQDLHVVNQIGDLLKTEFYKNSYKNLEIVLSQIQVHTVEGCTKVNPIHQTPHDSTHFIGTLIVSLPSDALGGTLIVTQDEQEWVYDFADSPADSNMVQFAAFYACCIHEIQPVLEGSLTLMYYEINRASEPEQSNKSPDVVHKQQHGKDEDEEVFIRSVSDLLDSSVTLPRLLNAWYHHVETVLQQRGSVGLFLSETYLEQGLTLDNLGVKDRLLCDYLKSRHVPISLVTVCAAPLEACGQSGVDLSVRLVEGGGFDSRVVDHRTMPAGSTSFVCGWRDVQHGFDTYCPLGGSNLTKHFYAAVLIGPLPRTLSHMLLVEDVASPAVEEGEEESALEK